MKTQDLNEAIKRRKDELIKRCNDKLIKFVDKMIIEDGLTLKAVYPDVFVNEVKFKWATMQFFKSTEEDIKLAKENLNKDVNKDVTKDLHKTK